MVPQPVPWAACSSALLVQLWAISPCPIPCYLGEETDTYLATASFQVVVESGSSLPNAFTG